jgi:hypothetical protein
MYQIWYRNKIKLNDGDEIEEKNQLKEDKNKTNNNQNNKE